MNPFHYQDHQLFCDRIPVTDIVQQLNTPAYIYSADAFTQHFKNFQTAFAPCDPLICYSVKACGNIHILKLLAELGSGFDVVSGGELYRVLQAGGRADKVFFAGVAKSDDEILQAMDARLAYFNIESQQELHNLARLAQIKKKKVTAALRINPDVDPHTHRHTTTGKKGTKFGIDIPLAEKIFHNHNDPWVALNSLHIHLGSPINSPDPYVLAIEKILEFIDQLKSHGTQIESLNIGGGFGFDYHTSLPIPLEKFAQAILPLLKNKNLKIILESGRSIAANAAILVTKVLYTKPSGDKKIVIVDASMNDFLRPALYDAFHFIWPVTVTPGFEITGPAADLDLPGCETVDLAGPVCESTDFFAKDRHLPPLKRDDLVAIFDTGAYGFVMSSQYNARPRPPEILVQNDTFRLIRKRESYHDLIAPEKNLP